MFTTLAILLLLTVVAALVIAGIVVLCRRLAGPAGSAHQVDCPFCGRVTDDRRNRCDWCGRRLPYRTPLELAELSDLEAMVRQLKRMEASGVLTRAEASQLATRVAEYRAKVLGERPAPRAAGQPGVSASPVVEAEPIEAEVVEEPDLPKTPSAPPPPPRPSAPSRPAPDRPRGPRTPELPRPVERPRIGPAPRPKPAGPQAREPVSREEPTRRPPRSPADRMPPRAAPSKPPSAPKPRPRIAPEAPPRESPARPPREPAEAERRPRRSWSELLSAFMEDRNIRIGELVGGLLFVVFSVLLTVSLWDQLTRIPYYQFFVLVAVSSAVFGAGLYAHHRLRLASTGTSVLVIATLLVPLNFFTMVGVSRAEWTWLSVAAELVSLGVFTLLVHQAACVLVPKAPWHQVVAVLGGSASVLVSGRWVGPETPAWQFVAAGCLPAGFFVASLGAYLARLPRRVRLDESGAAAVLTLLGTALFALAVPWGLMVWQASGGERATLAAALDQLAALLALAAVPVLACGLAVMRGTTRDDRLAAYRTGGTAVALLGGTLLLAASALAWPQPWGVTAVGTIAAVALALGALRYRLPVLHAGAIAAAAFAYLTCFHSLGDSSALASLAREDLSRAMLGRLFSARSGTALVPLFAVLACAAEWLARSGRRRHGAVYAGGAVAVVVTSLATVSSNALLHSGADAIRAAIVYAIYGVGCLALNARWRRPALSYVGLSLVAGASVFAMRLEQIGGATWSLVLAAESLALLLVAAALAQTTQRQRGVPWAESLGEADVKGLAEWDALVEVFRVPAVHVAEVVAGLALAAGLWTAWFDRAAILAAPTPLLPAAAVALTATWLLLAWGHRSAERTWLAAATALAGLLHTLAWNYTAWTQMPWPVALLAHATLATAGSLLIGRLPWVRSDSRIRGEVDRVLVKPLRLAAIGVSLAAVPVLAVTWSPALGWTALSAWLFWVSVIWLVLAFGGRLPAMLSAHQAALAAAAVAGAIAWLWSQGWGAAAQGRFLHPWTFQACAAALAAVCLAWLIARILLRRFEAFKDLLEPDWPAVDRVVLVGVTWLQLAFLALYLLPGVGMELVRLGRAGAPPTASATVASAFGPGAWLVLFWVAGLLAGSLWHRWGRAEMLGAIAVAVSLACVLAGRWTNDMAAASMLRWGLGTVFLLLSAAVWLRDELTSMLARWPGTCMEGSGTGRQAAHGAPARGAIVGLAALPVIALTVLAATTQLIGLAPTRFPAGVLFHEIHPAASYLVPLLLVIAGLVGHAVRERSAGYAFSAGLVVELAVVLGYALTVVLGGGSFGSEDLVRVVQLATIAAALWAGLWLAARRRIDVWREDTQDGLLAHHLMNVQLGMPIVGNLLLLLPGLAWIALSITAWPSAWVKATGWPLGWTAFLLTGAAIALRRTASGRRLRPAAAGMIGMALLGLLACTVHGMSPQWGIRTLMLGWASYALFVAAASWWVASVRALPGAEGPPQALLRAAAVWVGAAGGLAVLLGLKAALLHGQLEDRLWAAAAIAVASVAGATMAYWRRAEGWAFAAALGVNLAASLVVWYFQRELAFAAWWVLLVQANVVATSAVALVWLAARRRLYQLRELTVRSSPLLGTQTSLAVTGVTVLLALPVVRLVAVPQGLPSWAERMVDPGGWIALAAVTAAAVGYLVQIDRGRLFHALGGLGAALPVMIACMTVHPAWPWDVAEWTSYRVLMVAAAAATLALLGAGLVARRLRGPAGLDEMAPEGGVIRTWVACLGAAAVLLALAWCPFDPGGTWWRVGTVLAVSLAAGILALATRAAEYVFVSGLLANVAATIWWAVLEGPNGWALVEVNTAALAAASAGWTLVRKLHRQGVPCTEINGQPVIFAHLAALGSLAALVSLAGAIVVQALGGHLAPSPDPLRTAATIAVAAAMLALVWDRAAPFPLGGLYLVGLAALGMSWNARAFAPREIVWVAATELTGFALAASVAGWLLPRGRRLWSALRIEHESGRFEAEWFGPLQGAIAAAGAAVCVAVSLDFGFDGTMQQQALLGLVGRSAAIPGALMLLGVAVVMAALTPRAARRAWHYAGFAAGLLLQCSVGWALIEPTARASWLHRSVTLMVAAAMMTLLASVGLARIMPGARRWIASARRVAPVMGTTALAALVAVLVQEAAWFRSAGEVPISAWGIAVVAAALLGLVAACIAFAVVPGLDRLGLTERGRTAYVYAAEGLVLLLGVHFGLCVPGWFTPELLQRYGLLLVMGVAFAGAAMAEWFHRRMIPVLSEPLEWTAFVLPVVPAIGFWLLPEGLATLGIAGRTPAVWMLIAAFYATSAWMQRPAGVALPSGLAVAAFNVGLWIVWNRLGIGLFDHPQLWLIPVGLCVLVAEYLNHDRLSAAQSGAIRYLALSLIYVASTADMFLAGIGNSVVLPLVLLGLSVGGVLLGMLLRLRSFLVLGVTFLLVLLGTMIEYVAIDREQFWVVYACGAITGAAIIVLFAVFEKRRNDVMRAVEQFRQWER